MTTRGWERGVGARVWPNALPDDVLVIIGPQDEDWPDVSDLDSQPPVSALHVAEFCETDDEA